VVHRCWPINISSEGTTGFAPSCGVPQTRVQQPDEDEHKELGRAMKYLQVNIDVPPRLSVDDRGYLRWWVDAAYAVHPDT
jgi:hypothetical protein